MLNSVKYLWLKMTASPEIILYEKIKDSGIKKIAIYAMGEIGKSLVDKLRSNSPEIEILATYDRSATYVNFDYEGVTVTSPNSIVELDDITLVVASVDFKDEILDFIYSRINRDNIKIINL